MAAVGLNTSVAVFKGVGAKPFVVGLAGALVVGAVGMLMALLLGPGRLALTRCPVAWRPPGGDNGPRGHGHHSHPSRTAGR